MNQPGRDLSPTLKHATVWLLLALFVFLGVQQFQASERATRFVVEGDSFVIRRGPDGHYHWPGRIDGREVDFLVDTGATSTAIPTALARELELRSVGRVRSQTAGGNVTGERVVADLLLQGGVRADRLRITALPQLSAPLLGMDVLGRLQLSQSGGVLRVQMPERTR
ncbi:MAG: retroviral-like aspartic protease family protein [Pseudomonadota bacterium]|nr:retroviral-like aspartic protease family protein [Pseudomonadota bacterium]